MKLMMVSDIHGSPGALRKALALADAGQADRLLLLGDLLNHGPRNPLPKDYNPQEVAHLINDNAHRMTAVRGNCDSEVDQMLIRLPIMAEYALVLVDGRQLFLSHGHIWHEQNLPALSKGDVFCFGHTHIPVIKDSGGIFVFNPGSVTLPKGGHSPSVGWYHQGRLWITRLDGTLMEELTIRA